MALNATFNLQPPTEFGEERSRVWTDGLSVVFDDPSTKIILLSPHKKNGKPPKNSRRKRATMDSADQQQRRRGQAKKSPSLLSKRQRRAAGPNPSNTWQQQPRIKSANARARAYVSYAGLADDDDGEDRRRKGADASAPSSASASAGGLVGKGRPTSSAAASSLRDSLDPHLDLDSPEIKFGRLLGGTDQRSRHAAVKMLRSYLRSRSDHSNGGVGLSELDLLKLWKVSCWECGCL
jgi:hypothetical protein